MRVIFDLLSLEGFRWSSNGEYLEQAGKRPSCFGCIGWRGADYRLIRRGWCLSREEFRKELLVAAECVVANHYGEDRHETGVQKTERMVMEEMKRLGSENGHLQRQRKGIREDGGGAPIAPRNGNEPRAWPRRCKAGFWLDFAVSLAT